MFLHPLLSHRHVWPSGFFCQFAPIFPTSRKSGPILTSFNLTNCQQAVTRITSIPHNALGQEITSDTDQRRLVFMVAKIYQAFGMIAAAALPVLMGNLLGSCRLPKECDGSQEEVPGTGKDWIKVDSWRISWEENDGTCIYKKTWLVRTTSLILRFVWLSPSRLGGSSFGTSFIWGK